MDVATSASDDGGHVSSLGGVHPTPYMHFGGGVCMQMLRNACVARVAWCRELTVSLVWGVDGEGGLPVRRHSYRGYV